MTIQKDTTERWFDLEYRIKGREDWRPALSSGYYEGEAISNFAINYAPCMGIVVAVRIVSPGQAAKKLAVLAKLSGPGNFPGSEVGRAKQAAK
jgi:hypothetical protein